MKKGTHWKARERDLPYIYLYQVVQGHEFISAFLDPCFLIYKPQQGHRWLPGGLESHNLLS